MWKTPLIKLSICQNSRPKCKTQGFQVSMRHRPSCSWHLNTDFLCILCLQLRSPNTTQMPAPPPPPGRWGTPLAVPMFTLFCFGTLSKCSFGLLWCQHWASPLPKVSPKRHNSEVQKLPSLITVNCTPAYTGTPFSLF